MKKILILFIIVFGIGCKAQHGLPILHNVIPLQNYQIGTATSNDYIKDIDNILDSYVGTWQYISGNTSINIILKKAVNYNNGFYYEDMLYGEYQYIKDGIEIINTLPTININQNKNNNSISGNQVLLNNDVHFPCQQCDLGEKRISLYISNPVNHVSSGNIYLRRITFNGQPAIDAYIDFSGINYVHDADGNYDHAEYVEVTIPQAFYRLIKQP